MSKSKGNVDTLLAAIKRQPIVAPATGAPTEEASQERREPAPRHSAKKKIEIPGALEPAIKSKLGKPSQFWMHDEDRKLIRELSAWLAGQGLRPSDSMVIRAALRFAKTNSEFLEAYWHASRLDGRLKRD